MKTSELRAIVARLGTDHDDGALAAEVIRLREALAEAINLAEDVAAMPLPARSTADLRSLLAEHDE